jgi:hypothetical protein
MSQDKYHLDKLFDGVYNCGVEGTRACGDSGTGDYSEAYGEVGTYWLGGSGLAEATFTFAFDQPQTIAKVLLAPKTRGDAYPPGVSLYLGDSTQQFFGVTSTVAASDPSYGIRWEAEVPAQLIKPVSTLTVRIFPTDQGNYLAFNEIEIYTTTTSCSSKVRFPTPH